MQVGIAQCVNKGMQRDYSMDKASQEFAYENRNIRITTTGNNSFLSVTNEKSTIKLNPRVTIKVPYTISNIPGNIRIVFTANINEHSEARPETGTPIRVYFEDDSFMDSTIYGYYWPHGLNDITITKKIVKAVSLSPKYVFEIDTEDFEYADSAVELGSVLGSTTINNNLVLFCKVDDKDVIYKCVLDGGTEPYVMKLYSGNLNFDINNPIECIAAYESDEVQKVYWVDGINQPRYINVAVDTMYPNTETFNFTPLLDSNIDVTITKQYNGTGEFTSGVIQYFITLYKKYGAESNLAYESPLYYVSPKDRGGNIDEKQTCSFNIKIKNENSLFEGVKIYSILRTSYNAEPQAKLVYEGLLKSNDLNIIDEGKGIPIAPTDILFLNRSTISASTIEQKDNTLFLGDIKTLNITEDFIEEVSNKLKDEDSTTVSFIYRPLPIASSDNPLYNYATNLENPSYLLKYFKPREHYRIGFQFKTNTGEWSSVLGVRDIYCNKSIKYTLDAETPLYNIEFEHLNKEPNVVYVPALECKLAESWKDLISKYNIVEWRAVMAEHTDSTRTIKAQGLLLPTIYNLSERFKQSCYNTPLWNLGLTSIAKHNTNIDDITFNRLVNNCYLIDPSAYINTGILQNVYESKTGEEIDNNGDYYLYSIRAKIIGDRAETILTQDSVRVFLYITLATSANALKPCEDIRIVWEHRAFGQGKITCRQAYEKAESLRWSDIKGVTLTPTDGGNPITLDDSIGGIEWSNNIFYADEFPSEETIIDTFTPFASKYGEIQTITTPELVRNINYKTDEELISDHANEYFIDANVCNFISPDMQNVESGMKLRLVGSTSIANSISDYDIVSEDSVDSKGNITNEAEYNFNLWKPEGFNTGIGSFPLWPYDNNMFYVHYWQHSGPLSAGWDGDDYNKSNIKGTFNLKTKVYANMWYCNNTEFIDKLLDYPISSIKQIHEDTNLFQAKVYKKNYENLLIPKDKSLFYVQGQNETSSLENIRKALMYPKRVELDDVKTILIKNNSSPHCVVDLGNSNGGQYVLPNYEINTDNFNGIVYENFNRLNFLTTPINFTFFAASTTRCDSVIPTKDGGDTSNYYVSELIDFLKLALQQKKTWSYINTNDEWHDLIVKDLGVSITVYHTSFESNDVAIHENVYKFSDIYNQTGYAYLRIYDIANNYVDLMFKVTSWSSQDNLTLVGLEYNKPVTIKVQDKNRNVKSLTSIDVTTYIESENELILTPNYDTFNKSKLWIGEFYTPYNKSTFMGGSTEAAINSNVFVPIYGKYTLPSNGEGIGYGLEGDTYYQRWDHLRIFPSGENDVNQPIDALSIMVETHKNLDGDIRELRGRTDTINLTEENTNNVLNDVYSQPNNYLTYNVLNEKFNDSTYPTMYIWSLSKQALSTIDTWTQINLINAAKLDEVKGKLSKIKVWNNKLIAFQDKAIAAINFNNQTTISTNEGIPVEIANSGKVTGHYYISTTQGCKNKWSIIDSPAGIYFIDSYNKSINLLNDGIASLSTLYLFQDWINEKETGEIWKPLKGNKGFKSFYDPIKKDVYFSNNTTTLNFNELLNQFVSFYDYPKINALECIDGHIYCIHDSNLYKMFEGDDYCNLFGKPKSFSMTYKINKDPFIDKTWTNIEYRADVFDEGNISNNNAKKVIEETFDTLTVWNEYQEGTVELMGDKYPNAKNKFRIWRVDMPRDSNDNRKLNRIRNPWIMLKLEKSTNTNKRMEFHDLLVKYLQ